MDVELEDLRRRLAELPVEGGKRQYTADVKRRVLGYVERRIAGGATEAAACKAVGMHQATIAVWNGRKKRATAKPRPKPKATRVRAVEVVATPAKSDSWTLVFPGGAHVDGLGLEQVVEVAKAFR